MTKNDSWIPYIIGAVLTACVFAFAAYDMVHGSNYTAVAGSIEHSLTWGQ